MSEEKSSKDAEERQESGSREKGIWDGTGPIVLSGMMVALLLQVGAGYFQSESHRKESAANRKEIASWQTASNNWERAYNRMHASLDGIDRTPKVTFRKEGLSPRRENYDLIAGLRKDARGKEGSKEYIRALQVNNVVNFASLYLPELPMEEVLGGGVKSRTYWSGFSGSGFLISNQGHILTCNHVVDSNGFAEGRKLIMIDRKERAYQTKVLAVSPAYDIALLKADMAGKGIQRVYSRSDVKEGEKVYNMMLDSVGSSPFYGLRGGSFHINNKGDVDLENIISAGKVIRPEQPPFFTSSGMVMVESIEATAFSKPGHSGSPVIDQSGNFLGLVCTSSRRTSDIVPAHAAHALIAKYLEEVGKR